MVEFVESAIALTQQGLDADFLLVGSVDPGNPESISAKQLEQWNKSGVVKWLGERADIAQLLAESHIAVLPSYREGLPKIFKSKLPRLVELLLPQMFQAVVKW